MIVQVLIKDIQSIVCFPTTILYHDTSITRNNLRIM